MVLSVEDSSPHHASLDTGHCDWKWLRNVMIRRIQVTVQVPAVLCRMGVGKAKKGLIGCVSLSPHVPVCPVR